MKKLLAIIVVLGMASLANAAYMVTATPVGSGNMYDIAVSADAGLVGGELTLSVKSGPGTLNLTGKAITAQWWEKDEIVGYDPVAGELIYAPVYKDWNFAWGVKAGTTPSDITITIDGGNFAGTSTNGVEVLISGIKLNANGGQGEVAVNGIINGTETTEVTASYVPEPMTMSLLGLGGLALIRRRRA